MASTGVLPTLGRTLVQNRTCLVRKSPSPGQRPLGRSRTARAAAAPSTLQQASHPAKDSFEPTLPRRSHSTTSARSGRWVLTPAPASCVTSPQVLVWCFIASRCPRCLEVHGRLCPSVVLGRVAASLYVLLDVTSTRPISPYPHINLSPPTSSLTSCPTPPFESFNSFRLSCRSLHRLLRNYCGLWIYSSASRLPAPFSSTTFHPLPQSHGQTCFRAALTRSVR